MLRASLALKEMRSLKQRPDAKQSKWRGALRARPNSANPKICEKNKPKELSVPKECNKGKSMRREGLASSRQPRSSGFKSAGIKGLWSLPSGKGVPAWGPKEVSVWNCEAWLCWRTQDVGHAGPMGKMHLPRKDASRVLSQPKERSFAAYKAKRNGRTTIELFAIRCAATGSGLCPAGFQSCFGSVSPHVDYFPPFWNGVAYSVTLCVISMWLVFAFTGGYSWEIFLGLRRDLGLLNRCGCDKLRGLWSWTECTFYYVMATSLWGPGCRMLWLWLWLE